MSRILTLNVGSTSQKLAVLGDGDKVIAGVELPQASDVSDDDLRHALAGLGPVDAVGHRVVHGGADFTAPTRVDDALLDRLRRLVPLDLIHEPAAIAAMETIRRVLPGIPAVACFDTAFHATLPPSAYTYAVPEAWRALGARRYGFHGLSHAYASRRVLEIVPLPPERARVITCHLGGGASLAAIQGGRSVDTTMGLTPLEGLVMGSRSGSIDPGLVIWLLRQDGWPLDRVADDLEHHSGLTGLCGTADMRVVTDRAASGDPAAGLALAVYVHRLRAGIAAMSASLGGVDAIVFTGGVGEHSPTVRTQACRGLEYLGVVLDDARNTEAAPDADIATSASRVRVVVVAAREDIEIAAAVRTVLSI